MNAFLLPIAEHEVEEAVRLIQEGWTPETDDNESYAVDIDFTAELKADGFTVLEAPAFKDSNGRACYVKTYTITDIECPPPPKVISSYLAAVKPYVYAAIRERCKLAGITHVHSAWIIREGYLGLVSPKLYVDLRAYSAKPANTTKHEAVDASKTLTAKRQEVVEPFNPKDLSIGNTWYYYLDGDLVPHPVNYLTGQWLYDRLAHKVGADGTHFIFAVDDQAKRLVKVDRPEKIKLDKNWSFYSAPANGDRPTYNDYLHDMHAKKVAEANERSAKKETNPKRDAHEDDVYEAEKLYIRQDRTIDHNALFAYLHDKAESRRGWGRTMVQLPIGAVTAALMQWSKLQQTIDSAVSTLKKVESK